MDRFLVVLVRVAAEFKGTERRLRADFVGDDVIQCSVQRPRGTFDGIGDGAAQVTTGALGVDVRAGLKGPVHTRDQVHLVHNEGQGLHGCPPLLSLAMRRI